MPYSKQKVKKNFQHHSKETLELERNFGALAASPSMVTFFSSFIFWKLSNQPKLAV
jgi:hypothetical protein